MHPLGAVTSTSDVKYMMLLIAAAANGAAAAAAVIAEVCGPRKSGTESA